MFEEIKYEYNQLGKKSKYVYFKKSTKAKLIRITINPALKVTVTYPHKVRIEEAKRFFQHKLSWVEESLGRLEKRAVNSALHRKKYTAEEILSRTQYLIRRCQQLAKKYDFRVGMVTLRRQKSIWGSCSGQNNISLNANLAYLSDELIDYVIFHELVHTKIKNHSTRYWNKLEEILPGAKMLDQKLKDYHPNFHMK